ncbi:MAG: hypothetical protein ACOH17_03085 [Cellulomonas sp.]
MRALRRAIGAPEHGSAAVELIGLVAILLVVGSLCVQGLFLAQIGAATEKAARDGARASTLGRDVRTEVERQLPGWATIESLTTGTAAVASCAGRCVRLEVRVPIVLPGITSSSFTVTRDVDLPEG